MHELSIANSILEAVRMEASQHERARLSRVGIRVGQLAGIDSEALHFCFDSLVKGTPLDPLPLEIELRPRRDRCCLCGCTFHFDEFDTTCPFCGSERTECIDGTELELSYVELEEP